MIDILAISVRAERLSDKPPSGRPIMTFEEAMKFLPTGDPTPWSEAQKIANDVKTKLGL